MEAQRLQRANQSIELSLGVLAGKGEPKKAGLGPARIMYKRRMNAGLQEPSLQHRSLVSVPRNERNNGTRSGRARKAGFAQGCFYVMSFVGQPPPQTPVVLQQFHRRQSRADQRQRHGRAA